MISVLRFIKYSGGLEYWLVDWLISCLIWTGSDDVSSNILTDWLLGYFEKCILVQNVWGQVHWPLQYRHQSLIVFLIYYFCFCWTMVRGIRQEACRGHNEHMEETTVLVCRKWMYRLGISRKKHLTGCLAIQPGLCWKMTIKPLCVVKFIHLI